MVTKGKKVITVGITGNPNTGKTSLVNSLAGLNLHVGNWPGKTIERRDGKLKYKNKELVIVDLPGTYSIAPYSEEERISRDFMLKQNPDVIVQIIDVNALTRNLLMTLELLSLEKKIILAFNFNKEAKKRGVKFDVDEIRGKLEVPIVQIEANTGENKEELLKEIINLTKSKTKSPTYIKALTKSGGEIAHQKSLAFIEENIAPFYTPSRKETFTEKIDTVVLNKYIAFPIFFSVVFLMFTGTFNLAAPLVNIIDNFLSGLSNTIETLGLFGLLESFLVEGVIGGIGSILAFTPLIFILFIFITLLEDSGYLARVVVLVDRFFQELGISGRTFIPMILGFGCNVPGIMATRTIRDKKERLIAVFINPFMSCSARLPVYVLFTGIFFPRSAPLIIMLLYLFGILTAFVASFVLSEIVGISEMNTLIIELPPYRIPTVRDVLRQAWYQTRLFIRKAGSIIFVTVVGVWFLAGFPQGVSGNPGESFLGRFGQLLAPIFKPLGFGRWEFVVALLSGFVAKEVIIGTFGTLYRVGGGDLALIISRQLTPSGALSFLFFVLLYVPCLATIVVMRKETGSLKFTISQVIIATFIAWWVAFAVYNLGILLGIS